MSGLVVGRERELALLARVLEPDGPRVAFVYGMAGIGKSALLSAFAHCCRTRGVRTFSVDCRSIDPTEAGFRGGVAAAAGEVDHGPLLPLTPGEQAVLIVDTYEVFRIADPWLRHELLPTLPPSLRVVVAGRDAPMLEWTVERGRLGGLEVLPLGPLDDQSVQGLFEAVGLDDEQAAAEIKRVTRGHPLALRLALEAQCASLPAPDAMPRVIQALAAAFREGLPEQARTAVDAAAVPRRITRGVLEAMLGAGADAAFDILADLSFVEPAADGLRLHDAVHNALAERLRAVDPGSFRRLRTAAWHQVQGEMRVAGSSELARATADLLFLIDNPFVREAMFPTTAHQYSVESCRPGDVDAVQELWHRYDPPAAAAALDAWLRLLPSAVRVVRDRTGAAVGCSLVAEWRDIPPALERHDPVVAAWSRHAALHPLPPQQRTLTHRRVLVRGTGEGPSEAQAATWLDVKREYFRMRPHLGRLYTAILDPTPFLPALLTLGFTPLDEPVLLDDSPYRLAVLNTGPGSIDGWLSRIAAAELGIAQSPFLDAGDRSVLVGRTRIRLSPLEFGVLELLEQRPGAAVSRVELLHQVWGTSYTGGSNVVDVVVGALRKKLGPEGGRLETVRGVGYRLR
jgi:hypothetical protein